MFAVRYEGFPHRWQVGLAEACADVAQRSALATQITRPKTRQAMEEWFGNADNMDLWANLHRMNAVISDPGRTVTFVNAKWKRLQVDYNPDDIYQAPTPRAAPVSLAEMEGVAAYVFPVNMQAYPSGRVSNTAPLAHAGSGMRLYIGQATLVQPPRNNLDLVQTIYHELSHKILGTNDHGYGEQLCKSFVNDGRALRNADNYGFFLLDVR